MGYEPRTFMPALHAGVLALFLGLPLTPAAAQRDEPSLAELERTFKKPYLTVGLLVQALGDFQIERAAAGRNGFSLGATRVSVSGELDAGFGYLLQTEFTGGPAVLDARVSWTYHRALTITAGRFKTPFSGEFLIGAARIDFVGRAQVVSALAPGRQVGVQVQTGIADAVSLSAGAFNGTGALANDNNHLLYATRLAYGDPARLTGPSPAGFAAGLHAAVSEDSDLVVPGVTTAFTGTRILLGGDVRLARGPLLLSGEVLYADLDTAGHPWGLQATAGYMVAPAVQVLGRFDRFDPEAPSVNTALLGLNVWPTAASEIQVNYAIDPDDTDPAHHRLLVNFQVAF